MIGFLNGLSNFKQTVKLHFTAMDPFYFFENSNFKPYTQFLLPLEHGKHWSKMMVCPKTPIIESECSLSVRGILRFWGQKQKLNLTSILDHDKRSTQKKKWSLCSVLSCSKESEQQTALTKIKWRTKELFNPVVDFSPKRVEIVGRGWCQIVMVFWDY